MGRPFPLLLPLLPLDVEGMEMKAAVIAETLHLRGNLSKEKMKAKIYYSKSTNRSGTILKLTSIQ